MTQDNRSLSPSPAGSPSTPIPDAPDPASRAAMPSLPTRHSTGWRAGVDLVKDAAQAWSDDYASSMGAALAYYTLFSLAPLMLIVLTIVGFVFDAEAARGQIFGQLRMLMGNDGAAAIEGLLQSASRPGNGLIGSIVGGVVLVVGATTVFGELQSALDRIWRAPTAKPAGGVISLITGRLLSFGMVLAIGFLLLVSLVVNAGLAAWGNWTAPPGWEAIGQALNFVLSFVFITAAFAMIYRYMPHIRLRWHDVLAGAGFTALLFGIGKFVIGLYIGKSGVTSGFGAASSIVALLVWVYYSAQVFLFGAELTWVWAHRYGSLREVSRPR